MPTEVHRHLWNAVAVVFLAGAVAAAGLASWSPLKLVLSAIVAGGCAAFAMVAIAMAERERVDETVEVSRQ
jgi:uncharacterized OsmC-like protein